MGFGCLGFTTFIVGIVPGTLLAWSAVIGLGVGVDALLTTPIDGPRAFLGPAVLLFPVMGLVGYVALWRAALVPVITPTVAIGLSLGILGAAGALARLYVSQWSFSWFELFGGPIVIAVIHLGRNHQSRKKRLNRAVDSPYSAPYM